MRTIGAATLPLAAVGAAMVAAAVLPAVGAHAETSSVTARSVTTASTASAAPSHAARPRHARHAQVPSPHATTTKRAVHVVRHVTGTSAPAASASPAATRPATARPTPAATHSPAGRRTTSAHPRPTHTHAVVGPTSWAALNSAIARIPTYHAGAARWVISSRYGHWGTADWYHATMYIAPDVPTYQLFNVVVHEWSHELSVLDYDGNVAAATAAMNKAFGGSGLVGAERAADCMSRLQGATWTHYTSCTDSRWRSLAARLVAGHRL